MADNRLDGRGGGARNPRDTHRVEAKLPNEDTASGRSPGAPPPCSVGLRFRFTAEAEGSPIGPYFDVRCDLPEGHPTAHVGPIVTEGAAQGVRIAFGSQGDWTVVDRDRMADVNEAVARGLTGPDIAAIFEAARRIAEEGLEDSDGGVHDEAT